MERATWDLRWQNSGANSIEKLLPDDFYFNIARGKISRSFYPKSSDRTAWANIAVSGCKLEMKNKLIAEADEILSRPFTALSTYDYFRFVLEGDRARFEQAYFRRRNELGVLVMSLCLTGDREKYLPAVIDRLGAIAAEPFWCIHAHAHCDEDPMPCSNTAECVDLFAAETAATMALTFQLIGDDIRAISPRFYSFCKDTVLKKTVLSVLDNFSTGYTCRWVNWFNNWVVWCAANILFAGVIFLDDTLKLADLVRKLNQCCARYLDLYDNEGYCSEGPGYWFKSPVQLFCYCRTLETMMPGSAVKIFSDPKIRKMSDYGAMAVISGRDHVISADCGHIVTDGIYSGLIYDYGRTVNSNALCSFALNRMHDDPRRRQLTVQEEAFCRFGTGDKLATLLDYFFKLPSAPEKEPRKKLPAVSFWPDRLGIIRNAEGFSAAIKGGNNQEMHNHNDLGHFTLYYQDKPLVIDLGTGMYSRKNFNDERYTLFYTNGAGHNALCFGEYMQQAGIEFQATLEMPDPETLISDLSGAYSTEAGVEKYIRTLKCTAAQAVIADNVVLKNAGDASATLYSPAAVSKLSDDRLDFGSGIIGILQGALCEAVENVPLEDIPRHWGSSLCRIKIKTQGTDWQLSFQKS